MKSANLLGYVVYADNNYSQPIGVVSNTLEIRSTYSRKIPQTIKKFLVEIEDKRFFSHGAIDARAIARAIYKNFKHGRIVEGGSTITQQLARNLLRDNRKTLGRKIKETIKAAEIEGRYTKDEILNLYFNNIYFGRNIYGLRAAAISYYGKEPYQLKKEEQLALVTILRGPNWLAANPDECSKRFRFLAEFLQKRNAISRNQFEKLIETNPTVQKQYDLKPIQPGLLDFIATQIDEKNSNIRTSIDAQLQEMVFAKVADCLYPTTIVCLYKGNPVAFGSTFGGTYPFTFSSNVGSCLKPFIYCFLRENGIEQNDSISTGPNDLWPVKEVSETRAKLLSLGEALYSSNNNAFINASSQVGMEATLKFLTALLGYEELYPSAILGASPKGLSLFQLALLYHKRFGHQAQTASQLECIKILHRLLIDKVGLNFKDGYLKTGTTNGNKERFTVVGNRVFTLAILRQNYYENEYSKEGNFSHYVRDFLEKVISIKQNWFAL